MVRVAVVLRSPRPDEIDQAPSWIAELLHRLVACDFATLHAVIYVEEVPQRHTSYGSCSQWLFKLYERWDASRRPTENFALAKVRLEQVLAKVPSLRVAPGSGHTQAPPDHNADVLLCLDTSLPTGIAGSARFGTLLLDIADTYGAPDTPPVWRQHVLQQVVTSRVLQLSDQASFPKVMYETTTAVNPFSLAESRNPIYWKAVEVVLRSLQSLDTGGQAMLNSLPLHHPLQHDPGMRMAHFVSNELRRRINARRPRTLASTFAKWFIGIRQRVADTAFDSPANYRLLVSPRDRFYADPFLFQEQEKTWLFFEDFRYSEGRAVISCCELNAEGEPQPVSEVLRLPHHLSYPFVFRHEGATYMIPESRENRTVSMYRAVDFPTKWALDTELFTNVHMVDSTLHHDGEVWWMFAAVSNGMYSNSDELCLYFAETLRGPWTPHPQNPVISDVRRARPAGRLFYQDGRLIRPSQDCGPAYGYGLVFSEVQVLTRELYREQVIAKLEPESVPGNTANHTYDRIDHLEVIDRFFIESRLCDAAILPVNSKLPAASPHPPDQDGRLS